MAKTKAPPAQPSTELGPASLQWLATPQGQQFAKTIGLPATTESPIEQAKAQVAASKPVPQQQSVESLLSAILGGQQGQVPKGYADFFTSVLGPLMQAQSASFDKQLEGVKGADPNVIANLMAVNDATAKETGLGAQGLQQFVLGPLANYQKLIQQLQNALSFIPYSAQGIANLPVQAGSVLSSLGINPGASGLGTITPGTAPTAATAPPSLTPGAAITQSG